MRTSLLASVALAALLLSPSSLAQKGVGGADGVARMDGANIVEVRGTVVDAQVENCPQSTGRALIGAHLLLEADDGSPLNLHLGPLSAVEGLLAQAPEGTMVVARAFRTTAMPEGAFAAITVTIDGDTTTLRHADLRPVWAAGPRGGGRQQQGEARGRGTGARAGGCWWVAPEG